MDTSTIVAAASEQLLVQNGFYLRLQYTSTRQKDEIRSLQEKVAELEAENARLTERNKTFRCVLI